MRSEMRIVAASQTARQGASHLDALLVQAKHGDAEAFGEFARSLRAYLQAICFRVARNAHDAEDAVQEALAAMWRSLSSYTPGSNPLAWAAVIAARKAIQIARRRSRWQTTCDEVAGADGVPSRGNERGGNGNNEEEGQRLSERVRSAIAELPPLMREVLYWRFVEKRSVAETARILNVPPGTVGSRQWLAVRRLRRILGVALPATPVRAAS